MQEMQETWVQSLGREDPLEEEMAPRSNILAWEIPRAEEPGGLQTLELQRVGHGRTDTRHTLNIMMYFRECMASAFIPPFSC